ncbi:VOC family protein [Fluviicola taffensis]|uniref:Glyoxalase/bleomycin resistance protein/dioxygenase n=1 Tax=Fluviicola taffensis (strain DSM 16823 / NCIMB 13979 / RW262) TaxID=755732 RepID=F2IEL1_FLUTR|nr:VOC family protein [Fluviicola taffensis]AEA44550.1 Glyoxalase/bleomycin resistance protein/dioxygenase [Fluviicola taffensis DSM 16823]
MTKEIWLNLPVKDVEASRNFFTAIGFTAKLEQSAPEERACIQAGKSIIMLFPDAILKQFNGGLEKNDTSKTAQILISFDAETREEIDELAQKVKKAGGNVFSEPSEIQGWMYGFTFADLDGHRWNGLHMDLSKTD